MGDFVTQWGDATFRYDQFENPITIPPILSIGEATPAYFVVPPYPLQAGAHVPSLRFRVTGGAHRGREARTDFLEIVPICLNFNYPRQNSLETLRVTTNVWFGDEFYYIHVRWVNPHHGIVQQSNRGLARSGGFNLIWDDISVRNLS